MTASRAPGPEAAIRVATAADAALLVRLIGSFRDYLGASAPSDDALAESLPVSLADPGIEFCCAISSAGEPLGYSHARYFPSVWASSGEGHIEDLYLVESARGGGLGQRLLGFTLGRARERGARVVGLNTNEQNERALRFYEQAGFRLQAEARWPGGREVRLIRKEPGA